MSEWLTAQASWMYLEPIFGSPDILEQMPREGSKFHATNKVFRQIMADTENIHAMIDVRPDQSLLIGSMLPNTLGRKFVHYDLVVVIHHVDCQPKVFLAISFGQHPIKTLQLTNR